MVSWPLARYSLLTTRYLKLLRLLVERAFVIAGAELGVLDAAGLLALVLRCRVVAHLAYGTLECDDVSHCL